MSSEPPSGPAAWDCYAQVTSCPVEPDRAGPQGSPANLGRRVCEVSGKPPTPHSGPPILPLALAVDQAGESGEIPTHKAVWVWPRGSGAFRVGDAPWSWLWAESQRSTEALCRPYCDGSHSSLPAPTAIVATLFVSCLTDLLPPTARRVPEVFSEA